MGASDKGALNIDHVIWCEGRRTGFSGGNSQARLALAVQPPKKCVHEFVSDDRLAEFE